MFTANAFQVGGYAICHQGFRRIAKRSDEFIWLDSVEEDVRPGAEGWKVCTPGASLNDDLTKVKILRDEAGEYLQQGRARHDPKWRPWSGVPVPYRLMNADTWPGL